MLSSLASSMTEITTMVGGLIVSAVVVILTIILVKLFSRSGSRDSTNNGGGGGAGVDDAGTRTDGLPPVPIPATSSIIMSSSSWKYDVFLSFRGEDTRKNFVDHLYYAFQQHGILTYKDDETLDRGDTIGPSLLKAIDESQILVIIFSENYADSSWCLDELSCIMKCRDNETGQIVLPIFYHVDPSDVRKQKGQFGKAFAKHKSKNNKEKVETWKKTLVDATNIAGWEPKHVANGHEAKCIQEIVGSILDKLSSFASAVEDEDLVGLGTRLKDLKRVLRIGSGGVRMVGIWGVGGGGKTTLATSIYMELKISGQFHGCCFVENIREESKQQNGLKNLQGKILSAIFDKEMKVEGVDIGKHTTKGMLSRRKVLIVLDDVDDIEQLEALAGRHDWFGNGSRIIITTRNEQVLISHRVDEVYPISLLSHDEATQLFRRHAYQENNPVEDYEKLSLRVISYVNGLPLALKILGSFLCGKDKNEWMSALDKLKYIPNSKVIDQLKISYDGLDHEEKELFLDIACFHRGKKEDEAMVMLDACGFHPNIAIKVLKQKALISVSKDGEFDMHDLVQEMGHYIVRGEHPNNPEKHSRLWRHQDIEDVCSRNATAENDKIEAILAYNVCSSNFNMLVSNLKKLRFFKVTNYDDGPITFLSNELRYLDWKVDPAYAYLLPESFQPRKLVILMMVGTLQKELWKGNKYLPCLKELELSWMEALVKTPDFGGLPSLQKLMLYQCGSLEEIHQSLGNHSSLVSIEVSDCNKLTRFPRIVGMEKLEILKIIKCKALVEFPKIEAKMDSLVKLYLDEVGIEVLPSSVGKYCTNLISLKLKACKNLKSIEGKFHALKGLKKFKLTDPPFKKFKFDILSRLPRSLRKLNLMGCRLKDQDIPTEIGELSNLQELHLYGNNLTRLDFSLSRLTRLKLLDVSYCENLVELPELPSNLAVLKADSCWSLEGVIRDEIHRNCKWLYQVSIGGWGKKKNIIGGERLLETMLQGNGVESRCLSLNLKGLEIARGLEPYLVKGTMQLPSNWFNDFSGFLLCGTYGGYFGGMRITMKHEEEEEENSDWLGMGDFQHDYDLHWEAEEENGGWMGMGMEDSQHDDLLYWEEDIVDDDEPIGTRDESDDDGEDESVDDDEDGDNDDDGTDVTVDDDDDNEDDGTNETVDDGSNECDENDEDDDVGERRYTWVGYIPFSLLRHTSWWDPTSTAIQIREFGFKLVPKRGGGGAGESSSNSGQMETNTTTTHSSSETSLDDDDDDYKCKLRIEHDSKSALEYWFRGYSKMM